MDNQSARFLLLLCHLTPVQDHLLVRHVSPPSVEEDQLFPHLFKKTGRRSKFGRDASWIVEEANMQPPSANRETPDQHS